MPTEFDPNTSRSLFVVGDDAQSIYGFRGSKVEIILNFEKQYPGTTEIILNQNYRSTQPILDLAEKVLTHNPHQKKKELFTQNPDKLQVSYYLARNDRDEAEYIIRQIYQQYVVGESPSAKLEAAASSESEIEFEADDAFQYTPKANQPVASDPISRMFEVYLDSSDFEPPSPTFSGYNPSSWQVPVYNWHTIPKLNECVILYRTHSQSRSLEETFLKYKVPYRLVSGVKFLERREIKDVLAMLKFIANGSDKISLARFLPLLLDGVGPKTLEKIIAYLEDYEYPLGDKHVAMVTELLTKIQNVWLNNANLIDLTKDLVASSGYLRYLKAEYPNKEEYQTRLENIGELYSLMFPFDQDTSQDLLTRLNEFLGQISLMSSLDMEEENSTPKINLMSLHQSKGLEFETVFLVGVEDGLLPHQNAFLEVGGMEEEVRLAYVGVTRAKKYLHLVSADSRVQFGQIKANPISRIFRPFLDTHCTRRKN
jgi:superfamily I DNA/RNA helicase